MQTVEAVLADFPNSSNNNEIYRIVGESYYHLGNPDKALPLLSRYVAGTTNPLRSDLYILGVCYYDKSDYKKAVQNLSRTVGENDALTQNANLY